MALVKTILIVLIIAGLLAGGILYTTKKDAEYLLVSVNITQPNKFMTPKFSNLSAELVPVQKASEPKGTPGHLPGLTAAVYYNDELISYWTSTKYNGTDTYTLKVGLVKYPKKGEVVLINLQLQDATGELWNSLTYSVELQ